MSDALELVAALGGELITYRPYNGVALQFTAIVEREPSRVSVFTGVAYPENAILVTFPKDATDGVESISKGKDTLSFKRHLSDRDVTEFTVTMIEDEDVGLVGSDLGMWTVLVK